MRKDRKMLAVSFFAGFILIFGLLSFNTIESKDPNGWYHLKENGKEIKGKAIVTVKDFKEINLNSDSFGESPFYQITGTLKENKIKTFAKATEKAVGKQIGFLYNEEIISAPMINMPIETGNFSISNLSFKDKDRAIEIFEGLKREMDKNTN